MFQKEMKKWIEDTKLPDTHLTDVYKKYIKLIEEEGRHRELANCYKAIMLCHASMADAKNTIKYGKLYGKFHYLTTGEDERARYETLDYHRAQPTWGERKMKAAEDALFEELQAASAKKRKKPTAPEPVSEERKYVKLC
jgi:hypothetical protein